MREISNFKSGDDVCLSINIPEDDNYLITQNKSGRICFWNEENNQWILKKEISIDFFGFCKSLIFNGILYTSLKDSNCLTILIKTQETLKTLNLVDGKNLGEIMAFKIIVIKEETYILVAYEGNKLSLWALDKLEKISTLEMTECPMAVDYDSKTNKGICGNPTNELIIFSITKNLELKADKTVALINAGVASVKIRPDSKLVAVGCWDGKLKLYSWKTLVLLAVLDTHTETVQDICFINSYANDGKLKYLIAAASKDSKISLWDIYN